MSVNSPQARTAIGLLFLALLQSLQAGTASAATWQPAPQQPGSSSTWVPIVCESGSGWRPCQEQPTEECIYSSSSYIAYITDSEGMQYWEFHWHGQHLAVNNGVKTDFIWRGYNYYLKGNWKTEVLVNGFTKLQ